MSLCEVPSQLFNEATQFGQWPHALYGILLVRCFQAYLILGRFEDAEKDATVALQTEPYNTKAAYRRAKARLKLPQPDKGGACADLARVLSSNPKAQEASQRF